jgi:hypothetical protein
MPGKFIGYLVATILGWLAGGLLGIPLGAIARWSTRRFWIFWIIAIMFLSPLLMNLLDLMHVDPRFAVPGYTFLVEEVDRCTPSEDVFFEQMKDPEKMSAFVAENRWKRSCAKDKNFKLIESLDLIRRKQFDKGLPMLGQLLRENPSDPTIIDIVGSLERTGVKVPR